MRFPARSRMTGRSTAPSSWRATDWPGSAALGSQARLGCQDRLASYLNPQLATNDLAEFYAYPNQGAWAAGEHSVICEIRGTQGRLTGSVRASSP